MEDIKALARILAKTIIKTINDEHPQETSGGLDPSAVDPDSNQPAGLPHPEHGRVVTFKPNKIMKKIIPYLILILSLLPVYGSGQGYAAIATGFVPVDGKGYFNGQLTVGQKFNRAFIEYNQTVALTTNAEAPSYFQARAGYSFPCKGIDVHLFGGGGIRPATYLEEGCKVKGVVTYGVYITHEIDEDFYLKAELAMNNNRVMPTIGLATTFCKRGMR